MELSVELVDLIFSFLVLDRPTLFTCSRIPALSQIVERYLYHSITVSFCQTAWSDPTNSTNPTILSRFISENPRILPYVRVLHVEVIFMHRQDQDIEQDLNNFAQTLFLFPVLECIKLTTSNTRSIFSWPDVFSAALDDRLSLPTLKALSETRTSPFP
jgi:hypothetical protein